MNNSSGMRDAPFTDDEVESLAAYQEECGILHPFTCGECNNRDGLKIKAEGFYCPDCNYKQTWCHEWMTDWSWVSSAVANLTMNPDKNFRKSLWKSIRHLLT